MRSILLIFALSTGSFASENLKYSNARYGFSFEYPEGSPVSTIHYGSTHPFADPPLAYFGMGDGKQGEGYVTVNVSDKPADAGVCRQGTDVAFSGASFGRTDSVDGVTFTRDYRALRDGRCFDIQVISFASACVSAGCEGRKWSAKSLSDLLEKLDAYARTFRFDSPSDAVRPKVEFKGMKKFTEPSFGLTFWYPESWKVTDEHEVNSSWYKGGSVVDTIVISDGKTSVLLDLFQSRDRTIEEVNASPSGGDTFASDAVYTYDTGAKAWTVNFPNLRCLGNHSCKTWMAANPKGTIVPDPVPADPLQSTMGGLAVFDGVRSSRIIPITGDKIVVVRATSGALLEGVAGTVGATDRSIATPVGEYDQLHAIQAAKNAYQNAK